MTPAERVLRAYAACTPEERRRGLWEYEGYRRDAVAMAWEFGVPVATAAGVLAVLSPGLNWKNNQDAARAALAGRRGQGYGRNVDKAFAIVGGYSPEEVLSGLKVTAFYRLVRDGGNAVDICVDGHAFNLAWGKTKTRLTEVYGTPRQFELAREAYRVAARILGLLPCQVQAATWLAWRSSNGYLQYRFEFSCRTA